MLEIVDTAQGSIVVGALVQQIPQPVLNLHRRIAGAGQAIELNGKVHRFRRISQLYRSIPDLLLRSFPYGPSSRVQA